LHHAATSAVDTDRTFERQAVRRCPAFLLTDPCRFAILQRGPRPG